MRIKIDRYLSPFSVRPGVSCLIPQTELQIHVYPALIRMSTLGGVLLKELHLEIHGPMQGFTVMSDLEKGVVKVWGRTPQGFLRYRLAVNGQGQVELICDKAPAEGLVVNGLPMKPKERLLVTTVPPFQTATLEHLSLGSHKAQDIDLIQRRMNLTEIWPLLYQQAQLMPSALYYNDLPLLNQCGEETIPEKLGQRWLHFFQAHLHGILVPRLFDDQYQGFVENREIQSSPLSLLSEGMRLIRRSFIRQEGDQLFLLPLLPPELHCGRLTGVRLISEQSLGSLDLEWTKKQVRRLVIRSEAPQTLSLHLRRVSSFRLRTELSDKGRYVKVDEPFFLEKKRHYFFDNFS